MSAVACIVAAPAAAARALAHASVPLCECRKVLRRSRAAALVDLGCAPSAHSEYTTAAARVWRAPLFTGRMSCADL
eukprot:1587408-Pleurochrysis_carterae.AAC.1